MPSHLMPAAFKHDFFPDLGLKQINDPDARYYETPDGHRFKSVTTLLGERMPKSDWLEKWQKRVGEDKADRILTQAGYRGDKVHKSLEKFMLNDPDYEKGLMVVNKVTVRKYLPTLRENITKVCGLEHMCYSTYLRAAGSIDCVAYWNGKLAVIDFKTSRKAKKKKDILSYFLQATAYAIMVRERFGVSPELIVIVMAVDDEPEPRVFVENPAKYAPAVVKLFRK